MGIDLGIAAVKSLFVIVLVLSTSVVLLWIERKGSALIQDRIGANRASIFGRFPVNLGILNTMVADPIKMFTKEDVVPAGADRFLHTAAPVLALFPVLVTFIVIPFGDVLVVRGRVINLQAAELNVGVLYVLAMVSLGVYGVVLGGWASNNRWSLLGGIRGSAQMISYEIAMGLSLIGVIIVFGTLDLQEIARAQGRLWGGWVPAWGILYQPVGFVVLLVAGVAESKRIPFDLPEAESELISGYYLEYSGAKQAAFMLVDFVEIIVVSGLVTTLFFGGWQVPYLFRAGLVFPWGATLPLSSITVMVLQILCFAAKVLFFCWLQILLRWTLPRFRYDQLMALGWKGLLPLSLANILATAFILLVMEK